MFYTLTRHNGRSGKNGVYNPRHNDRSFNVENSDHIDADRAKKNVYWDCMHGLHGPGSEPGCASFEDVEKDVYQLFYNSTRNSANIAIIINFDLGLRVSELSALKWSDIDWKNQTVFIQRQESERKVEDYVKSDSSSGYRELPLNSQVLGLLERLRQDFGNVSEFIFTDEDGNRKSSSALQKRLIYAQVGKNGDKADSEVKRIHCQRRTVGTRIANQCGLEAARQWLGHTDLQTTLRYIYSTETLDTLRGFSESTSAIRVLDFDNGPEKDAVLRLIQTDTNILLINRQVSISQGIKKPRKTVIFRGSIKKKLRVGTGT